MKTYTYPKNKEYFKRLVSFSKKIISILQENKIKPVIYGSFAHFYYTKDEGMKINDIDLMVHKKDLPKTVEMLKKHKIKHKYVPEYSTIIIKQEGLKVEIDSIGRGYGKLNDKNLLTKTKKIDFYGKDVKIITLKQLEDIYGVAYNRTEDNKIKIGKRIKHLESFLGRRLK